ncbi:hypothetical protein D3C72_1458810 [compost metagenome]
MAGGGEKACLADIRLVGGGSCLRQFAVDACKLNGSLRHALLQRFVCLFQRLIARHPLGDIGEGGDDAFVRHGVGAHFDDALAARQHQREGQIHGQEAGDQFIRVTGGHIAAFLQHRNDIRERYAHLPELLG